MAIRKAEKQQAKLRLAIVGPTGSGKTYSALSIAKHMGGRIGVIDTERNSACLYSDTFEFDVEADMASFSPGEYVNKINEFASLGYEILVIDSLSHAWSGQGGALEMVDEAAKRNRGGNSFASWREVTPQHNRMVEAILAYPGHVIVTMRSKMEYVLEEDGRGKKVPRKIGMAPIQRDGLEYEFTVVGDMNTDHEFIVTKSRCSALAGKVIKKPGKDVADVLMAWLSDGKAMPVFSIQLRELLESLDFSPEQGREVIEKVLTSKKVPTLDDLSPADQRAFCDALIAGKFDKHKQPATAA